MEADYAKCASPMYLMLSRIFSEPSAGEVINYHLPEDLQARAHYLLEQNGEDLLTPAGEGVLIR